jgi:predicted MPP superfamily phosphohydrolase
MNQTLSFVLFFTIIFCLFGLMQWYLYLRYKKWLGRVIDEGRIVRYRRVGLAFLIIGSILVVSRSAFTALGLAHSLPAQVFVIYPGGLFYGTIVLGFLVLGLTDLGTLIIKGIGRFFQKSRSTTVSILNPSRRRFLKAGGVMTAGSFAAVPIIASIATREYKIVRLPLAFENLPHGLDGLTIAQVSDIHSGPFMTESQIRDIFEVVNSLHPNITVITGDCVDSNDYEIEPLAKALPMLKAEHGMFCCLGNHDHFATADRVSAAIKSAGITLLNNDHRTLPINGERLSLIGVDDAGKRRNYARLDKAVHGLDPETFKIMLTHQPRFFPEARKAGMDLTLAGHTHGGQVGIEFAGINLNPVYLVHEYARGLYREDGKTLYVNVGVGMVGVPFRLVAPEITLVTLRSA